jgi:hypothetical protein
MGRPKGSKNKEVVSNTSDTAKTVNFEQTVRVEKIEVNDEIKKEIEQKEKVLKKEPVKLEPLQVGQAYFEAPDGTVIIGEDTKNEIWYRAGNNGKGMYINKKR